MKPKCRQNVSKMYMKCRQNEAKMYPECRQNEAKMLPECIQNVSEIYSKFYNFRPQCKMINEVFLPIFKALGTKLKPVKSTNIF